MHSPGQAVWAQAACSPHAPRACRAHYARPPRPEPVSLCPARQSPALLHARSPRSLPRPPARPTRSQRLAAPAAARPLRPAIQPSLSGLQYTICIATQFHSNQPPKSRYKFCIVTLPSQPTVCNTIFVLQHTSNSPCNTIPVAIQFFFFFFCIASQPSLFLQYNPAFQPSYCNINQPVAIQKPLTSLLKPLSCNTN